MVGSLLAVGLAFLLGGVLGGCVVGRLRGVDLRQSGSGNIGATNALRTQGKGFALAVLAIDAGKGALAARWLPLWCLDGSVPEGLALACGAAAVFGHCFSPFNGFNGGKGVATLAGVFAAALPAAFPWMFGAFALTVLLTGVVSLATLVASVAAIPAVGLPAAPEAIAAPLGFTLAMTALVLYTHRENWQRLRAGRESRFERARLLGRALGLPPLGLSRKDASSA